MSEISALRQEISNFLPAHLTLSDEQSKKFYGRDWIKDFPAAPSLVVLPETN